MPPTIAWGARRLGVRPVRAEAAGGGTGGGGRGEEWGRDRGWREGSTELS